MRRHSARPERRERLRAGLQGGQPNVVVVLHTKVFACDTCDLKAALQRHSLCLAARHSAPTDSNIVRTPACHVDHGLCARLLCSVQYV